MLVEILLHHVAQFGELRNGRIGARCGGSIAEVTLD
jgi:hypothetical protein